MNKELKFKRAHFDANGKFIKLTEWHISNRERVFPASVFGEDLSRAIDCQFINMKDKAGKDVYEYHIVEYSVDGYKQASNLVVDMLNIHLKLNESDSYYRIDQGSIKIIGNVFQNPELITDYEFLENHK